MAPKTTSEERCEALSALDTDVHFGPAVQLFLRPTSPFAPWSGAFCAIIEDCHRRAPEQDMPEALERR